MNQCFEWTTQWFTYKDSYFSPSVLAVHRWERVTENIHHYCTAEKYKEWKVPLIRFFPFVFFLSKSTNGLLIGVYKRKYFNIESKETVMKKWSKSTLSRYHVTSPGKCWLFCPSVLHLSVSCCVECFSIPKYVFCYSLVHWSWGLGGVQQSTSLGTAIEGRKTRAASCVSICLHLASNWDWLVKLCNRRLCDSKMGKSLFD